MVIGAVVRSGLREFPTGGGPLLEFTKILKSDFLFHIKAKITNASRAPATYRQGDSYIMDSLVLNELSRKERILINCCRIFQQVECLSDIATADGSAINREWLSKQKRHRSSSNKVWPLQGDPGAKAWKIWARFLMRAFTDGSGNLIQQLSRWKSTDHRTHFAYYYQQQLWLYWRDNEWTVHNMRHHGRRELFFNCQHTKITREIPKDGVPIDVKNESKDWIVTGKAAEREQQRNTIQGVTLMEKCIEFSTLTNTSLNIVVDESDLKLTMSQETIIDIASDGSHDQTSGNLAYGWVMAINGTVIAKGQGRVSCPRQVMSGSYRSEAYGIAAAAQFTVSMVNHFKLKPAEHKWYIYLDNKTLIQNLERYQNETELSKWNLQPDADMVKYAHKLLKNIPANFTHVKSHQNSGKSFQELSLPVQMNTLADQLATEQPDHSTRLPEIYVPFCYLTIKGVHITRDSKQQLMEEASRIPIQQYYKEKYGWKSSTFHLINWQIQQRVLTTYSSNDQRRILKMVHSWLPTYARLHRENQTTNPRCPLCNYRSETSLHIFRCKHPRQQELYGKITHYLKEDGKTTGSTVINHVITVALENTSNPTTLKMEKTGDVNIDKWIQDQAQIGWEQILYGQTPKSLEKVLDTYFRSKANSTGQETGAKWIKRLIHKIWDTFLQLWLQRNEIIHGKQEGNQSLREQQFLEARVSRCYEYQYKLQAEDRGKIFYKSLEEMLGEDARYLKAWIKLCERIIRVYKKENTEKSREGRFMEKFFKWKPRLEPTRNRPKKHTPNQKQDLHPD
jgi:hypothetical protein